MSLIYIDTNPTTLANDLLGKTDVSTEFLSSVCAWILSRASNPSEIEKLFNEVDIDKTDNIIILSLLRYSFSIKDNINNWKKFRKSVNKKLYNTIFDNKEIIELMQGLYDHAFDLVNDSISS